MKKLTKKLIATSDDENQEISILGKWNSNVFYVNRKKLAGNKFPYKIFSYFVGYLSADHLRIDTIYKDSLFTQITYDGVFIELTVIDSLIGDLKFFPRDNDRRTIGFQNSIFQTLDYRKEKYGKLENWCRRKLPTI
ncbi:hypothetical protein LZ575_07855 [Antarcticibacterium sp. 1MA-6-2]|uniref:DUF6933 domain-containing protein n=1 Tax=Antarcticibacterium sp. 1MA-6-2 TaxID=2908210 RepID=UPI001F489D04|nr:hypothetical protein [Antarcticibacterium sp. 1MA-6-2]UJH92419.1 hypothetical protein LZ575_07855 [Antarcticibacterium sp. 1MA-6-2]